MHSPVEQFTIKVLYSLTFLGYDISFTNSSLFMVLAVLVSSGFLYFAMRPASVIPGKVQCFAEMIYEFFGGKESDYAEVMTGRFARFFSAANP